MKHGGKGNAIFASKLALHLLFIAFFLFMLMLLFVLFSFTTAIVVYSDRRTLVGCFPHITRLNGKLFMMLRLLVRLVLLEWRVHLGVLIIRVLLLMLLLCPCSVG